MKYQQNIRKLEKLAVDWMGLIFYSKSPRFVRHKLSFASSTLKRIGVFVNANASYIAEKIERYQLHGIQLHGQESEALCKEFRSPDLLVIKAFSVDQHFNFDATSPYIESVDYYLFDTKSPLGGGSGRKFNWSQLERYKSEKPFILSGGIGPNDVANLQKLSHPSWHGIDVNSQFELRPGYKNINALKKFQHELFGR